MNKNVVIFFPNHHLAYSPTTINLYVVLKSYFSVRIIAPYPSKFNNKELINVNVEYFNDKAPDLLMKGKALLQFFIKNIFFLFSKKRNIYKYSNIKLLSKYDTLFKHESEGHKNDIVIVIDILFLKIATKYFDKVNFVSLELNDELIPLLDTIPENKINSVIIQTKDRYNYLFRDKILRVFYIQNSVLFDSKPLTQKKLSNTVIFNGTASSTFGVFYFLDFLRAYSNQFSGVIKGTILIDIRKEINSTYDSLIKEGKLILDDAYLESKNLTDYVSSYEIGICFYDIDSLTQNRFNYLSAPSGKMFTYFASGVPVIGSDIPGLKLIEEIGAGVLISDYSPQSIFNAINIIKADYDRYYQNCLKAASHYSFDKQAKAFIDYLSGE